MGDHRKQRRARGVTVRGGGGTRQKSGLLDESTPRELNRAARKAIRGVARRRVLLAIIGALVIIGTSVGVSLLVRGRPSSTTEPQAIPSEAGASLLIAVTDSTGRDLSLALLGTHDQDATVALFPPGLLTVLPGFGDREISDSTRFGDEDLPALTVANLLGVRVDATAQMTVDELAGLLNTDLTVDLTSQLVVASSSSEIVQMDVGSAPRSPGEIIQLFSLQGVGTQLEWLDRQGSVWKALFDRMNSSAQLVEGVLARVVGDPALAKDALAGVATAEDPQLTAVPAERIERPGGDSELYQMSGEDATAFAAERYAYLRFTTGERPRVEILNGNGRIGTTRPVAAALIRHGFRVVRTDNADSADYAETQIIAQGRDHQQAALDARSVLGRGEVLIEVRHPSGVVDVTIIVGQDIPAQEA
jgi:hypothetical protein